MYSTVVVGRMFSLFVDFCAAAAFTFALGFCSFFGATTATKPRNCHTLSSGRSRFLRGASWRPPRPGSHRAARRRVCSRRCQSTCFREPQTLRLHIHVVAVLQERQDRDNIARVSRILTSSHAAHDMFRAHDAPTCVNLGRGRSIVTPSAPFFTFFHPIGEIFRHHSSTRGRDDDAR